MNIQIYIWILIFSSSNQVGFCQENNLNSPSNKQSYMMSYQTFNPYTHWMMLGYDPMYVTRTETDSFEVIEYSYLNPPKENSDKIKITFNKINPG